MTCSVEGCNRSVERKGMCGMHYARIWRTGTTDPAHPMEVCKTEGCGRVANWKSGYCTPCYKQQWYLKSVGRSELMERTSQERWVHTKIGYVMIKVDGVLVYEHRALAEKALGKPLPPGAIVHHTKARDDNHGPFKLVVCPDQEYHILLHRRMQELGYESN